MGVTANKTTQITNRDATPVTLNNSAVSAGALREATGQLEALTTDSVGSTYRMVQIPSNARISRVLLSCDAATAGAFDIGVYKSTQDGGTVVDADHFASAVSVGSALSNSDVTHESGVFGIENIEKALWSALALSSDPNLVYDITLTTTTVMTAQATIGLKVVYAI